jgi:hypothetical protein
MPKATIKYNLDNIDDQIAFERANAAGDMASALHDMAEVLRTAVKHGNIDGIKLSSQDIDGIDKFRTKFYEIIDNNALKHIMEI